MSYRTEGAQFNLSLGIWTGTFKIIYDEQLLKNMNDELLESNALCYIVNVLVLHKKIKPMVSGHKHTFNHN